MSKIVNFANLGDTIPKYRDLLLNTVLTGARDSDSLVRASSISSLGEICKLLHFSLGNIVHEVCDTEHNDMQGVFSSL